MVLLLVLNAQKCPEDRERDQEPISRPLRAVCATDHGQRAGLRAVLVIAPPKVSVVDKLRRILSENTMICAVFPPARAVGVAALTFPVGQVAWFSQRHRSRLNSEDDKILTLFHDVPSGSQLFGVCLQEFR